MWWISYSLPTCETKAPVTPLSRVTSVALVGEPPCQLDTHPFFFLSFFFFFFEGNLIFIYTLYTNDEII